MNLLNKNKLEIKYGVVIGVLVVIWLLLEYIIGLHNKHHDIFLIVTNLVLIIPVVGIYKALSRKKNIILNGTLTFSQGFISGLKISILYALIGGLGQYLYHKFINPFYFDLMISKSQEKGVSTNQAENYFNVYSYVSSVVFSYLIFGIIVSLIISLILRTKKK